MTKLKLSRKRLRSSEEDGDLFLRSPKRRDFNFNRDAFNSDQPSNSHHLQNGFRNHLHEGHNESSCRSQLPVDPHTSPPAGSQVPHLPGLSSHLQQLPHLPPVLMHSPYHDPSVPHELQHHELASSSARDDHYHAINRVLRDAHFSRLSRQPEPPPPPLHASE